MKAVVALSACRTALAVPSQKVALSTIRSGTRTRGITPGGSRSISSASINRRSTVPWRLHQQKRHITSARHEEPTIYALSTAPGRAAIAVVRISGPACLQIYRSLCPGKPIPEPRYATLRTLYAPKQPATTDSILDSNALVFYYPAPRSATGEDVLELHVHGGTAIVKAVLSSIPQCIPTRFSSISSPPAIRYAEPGEFTRRAFLNSRLDLTQVEALGHVLSATTEQQRRLSVRGTTNALSQTYERWRHDLLYARGELEALIDFSEDQHFDESPAELCSSVAAQVLRLKAKLLAHSRNAVRGELLRNGISIALLGAPNVGKSSLLNRIVGREAAIVSQEAGTTRDVVEVGVDLGGFFVRLGDTAGLRMDGVDDEAAQAQRIIGQIEREGMKRSRQRAAESDVVIVVLSLESIDGVVRLQLDPEVIATAMHLVQTKDNVHVLINKADLCSETSGLDIAVLAALDAIPDLSRDRTHTISCRNADLESANPSDAAQLPPDPGGIQAFLRALTDYLASLTEAEHADTTDKSDDPSTWQDSLGASERHRLLLLDCIAQLDAFLLTVGTANSAGGSSMDVEQQAEADIVVAAEHLRGAADCLAKITGRGGAGDVEEVLGVVFEKFCVGK